MGRRVLSVCGSVALCAFVATAARRLTAAIADPNKLVSFKTCILLIGTTVYKPIVGGK